MVLNIVGNKIEKWMIVLVHMNQMLDPMKPTVTSNRKCHILGLLGSTNPRRIYLLEY